MRESHERIGICWNLQRSGESDRRYVNVAHVDYISCINWREADYGRAAPPVQRTSIMGDYSPGGLIEINGGLRNTLAVTVLTQIKE